MDTVDKGKVIGFPKAVREVVGVVEGVEEVEV